MKKLDNSYNHGHFVSQACFLETSCCCWIMLDFQTRNKSCNFSGSPLPSSCWWDMTSVIQYNNVICFEHCCRCLFRMLPFYCFISKKKNCLFICFAQKIFKYNEQCFSQHFLLPLFMKMRKSNLIRYCSKVRVW